MILFKRELINAMWKLIPGKSSVRINGIRFKVPLAREFDRRLITHKHEPWMTPVLEQVFRVKQGTFVDLGANAGQILLRYKALFPSGKYLGFEPNAHCVAYVQEIIELNEWTDCCILPVGIGSKTELATLSLKNISDPCASVTTEASHTGSMLRSVLILRADEAIVLSGVGDPAVIKIDVEGMEAEVIDGLKNTLTSHQPILICEVLPARANPELKSRNESITTILKSCGYRISEVWGGDIAAAPDGLNDRRDVYIFADEKSTSRLLS